MKLLRKTSPIIKTISSSIIDLPTPINISLWWNYGSLLGLLLFIQIITEITLSIHYTPDINLAFLSLTHITRNVNWGWLLHNLHINGASIFILFIYIHIRRRIYYNSFYIKKTWNIGVSIFILTIATAFIGYMTMRSNKILRCNSNYEHFLSYSLYWKNYSWMIMRRICCKKSYTKPIFYFTFFNPSNNMHNNCLPFNFSSWKWIKQSHWDSL